MPNNNLPSPESFDETHDCPECGGRGSIVTPEDGSVPCGHCGGIGELTVDGRELRKRWNKKARTERRREDDDFLQYE